MNSLITFYPLFQIFPDNRIKNLVSQKFSKLQLKFKRQKDIWTIQLFLQIAQNGQKIYLRNLVARWKTLVSF